MSRRVYRLRARALLDSLRAIRRAGTRLPALTVGGYRVGLAPSNGRLYVTQLPHKYLGEITASGLFRPAARQKGLKLEPIQAIVERTVEVVQAVAAATEGDVRCAICNRILFPSDRERGFGKACWVTGEFDTYERRSIAAKQRRVKIERRERRARRVK